MDGLHGGSVSRKYISSKPLEYTSYYVSNSGDDNNDGLLPSTPWKTISKINSGSFSAGDRIFFKKGDIWREGLATPSSGSSGSPIVFSSYGTGDDPIISGSDIVTDWTLEDMGTFDIYKKFCFSDFCPFNIHSNFIP